MKLNLSKLFLILTLTAGVFSTVHAMEVTEDGDNATACFELQLKADGAWNYVHFLEMVGTNLVTLGRAMRLADSAQGELEDCQARLQK